MVNALLDCTFSVEGETGRNLLINSKLSINTDGEL